MTARVAHHRGMGCSMVETFVCLCVVAVMVAAVAPVIPKIRWTDHSTNHAEASEIQQCLKPENIEQVWINSSGDRLNCLVRTSQGIGDAVIQWSRRQLCWLGITAYKIGGGDLSVAEEILRAKACTQVWP